MLNYPTILTSTYDEQSSEDLLLHYGAIQKRLVSLEQEFAALDDKTSSRDILRITKDGRPVENIMAGVPLSFEERDRIIGLAKLSVERMYDTELTNLGRVVSELLRRGLMQEPQPQKQK